MYVQRLILMIVVMGRFTPKFRCFGELLERFQDSQTRTDGYNSCFLQLLKGHLGYDVGSDFRL
jgi:hypothetical protein